MPIRNNRGIGAWLAIALSASAIAGTTSCTRGGRNIQAEPRWYEYNARDDHKKSFGPNSRRVAAALSITSGELPGNQSPLQAAVNCTVALRSTIANLEQVDGNLGAGETAALRKAEAEYGRRAGSLAASESKTRQGVLTMIEEQFGVRQDQRAAQAQLAMTCLSALMKS